MYMLRRWWGRHGVAIMLGSLTLIAAWLLRRTQGATIFEIYQLITRPFQSLPAKEESLSNARTLELQQQVEELKTQNQKLKELLGYKKTPKKLRIVAPVVGRSADSWWQEIILGRGSESGIKKGFVVMAPGGVVGRVVTVTPHTSRALLISDPTSKVGAVISRSRSMGFLRGQGTNRAIMQFFDKVPNVRPGDAVATSTVSQLFPAGLPLGRVESVILDKSPAPEAIIELTAPMSYLEWVIIDPNDP
ncbi:rod shape-determining protein MreC [Moorena sp. SIO2C4]|uniref:rod shape-determining protein MreC n=1 Tax=Moorena sp. SIO2C4 TaxID=2607824 RepID=UPI00257D0FC5|nr:rod shape-determining protein MreC [Moorena sp. SIO2C4]